VNERGYMKKRKTKAQYEMLFERLMKYTPYKNVGQIGSLKEFFDAVKKDAEGRGRHFNVSGNFKEAMESSWKGLVTDPVAKTRVFKTKTEEVVESRNVFRNFDAAKRTGLIAVNEKGRAVYKSLAKRKGKEVTVYRDSKGRFAKAPVITYAGSYER